MKYLLSLIAVTMFAVPALANASRISNELAVVKACDEAVTKSAVSLGSVYNASVADSGKTLEVTLQYKNGNADCKTLSWFKHDGTVTACEPCQDTLPDGSVCACVSGMCTVPGSAPVMQYIEFRN
jgi:hypothetical protein